MKEEYRRTMDEIFFSEDDKIRILANVKEAYQRAAEENKTESVPAHISSPNNLSKIPVRRIGTVAAAFIAVCVSAALIHNQFITLGPDQRGEVGVNPATAGAVQEEIWEELDSLKDIETKTDCRTYTLSNLSKQYKVKKVEVANAQRHVKITYQNKKDKDQIVFEYKEETDSPQLKGQFSDENELATEKIDGSDIKMYGTKKCSGMIWEDETCTFAVKMSKACSTKSARRIVSGTKEEIKEGREEVHQQGQDTFRRTVNPNAVGWDGGEKESGEQEGKRILKKVYELFGFRVALKEPAVRVTYKCFDKFESFAFYCGGEESLENKWIIGYAGTDSDPDSFLEGYEEAETISTEDTDVTVYESDGDKKVLLFTREDIYFTLFLDEYEESVTEELLEVLLSVFEISYDEDETEPDDGEEWEPDISPETDSHEMAARLQSIVAEKSLTKLSAFISYPLKLEGLGVTVFTEEEFQQMDPDDIFTEAWVNDVLACDIGKIRPKTKSFTLGDSVNLLVCEVKDGVVMVTELHIGQQETSPYLNSTMVTP